MMRLSQCVGLLVALTVACLVVTGGCGGSGGSPPTDDPGGPGGPGDQPWLQPGTEVGQVIVGPDGGEMVWVPAGTFPMGSEEWSNTRPVRDVTMSGFWIGRHEVTNARYRAFCNATGREFPAESNEGDDHPVVRVSWTDAMAYAQHYGLSLPTEAQWEYAAAGPEGLAYPWGNDWDGTRLCWHERTGPGGRTFPVGSFPEGASWCGALDMAGNVSEYCADWYQRDYYEDAPSEDPQGPGEGAARSVRGQSYLTHLPARFQSAFRFSRVPNYRLDNDGGFRCVSTP